MANLKVLTGSALNDLGPGNVVFQLPNHTVALPRLVRFQRKATLPNGRGGYFIRSVVGVTQADGSVMNQLVTLDVVSVPGAVAANHQAGVDPIKAAISTSGLAGVCNDLFVYATLPSAADINA